MKPAPPVTRIIEWECGWKRSPVPPTGAPFYHRTSPSSNAVVVAIPRDEAREAVLEARARRESGGLVQTVDRRIRRRHVAGLEVAVVADRVAAEQPLEGRNETFQPDRLVMADVVHR